MDVNDISSHSPLLGLLNSPVRRVTPAVPTPDWGKQPQSHLNSHNLSTKSEDDRGTSVIQRNPTASRNTPSPALSERAEETTLASVVPAVATTSSLSTPSNRIGIPLHRPTVTQTPQVQVNGDVALTPTNSAVTPTNSAVTPAHNPHAAMVALTPMASGPAQAKNSIKLQNCVSTVSLGCELKLLDIYCRTRFSEYNPSRFHGVVMKILEPRATALIFRSGKIVCTGAKNEHDSYIAARKFARIIQKLGFPARFVDFKIQNFIATADLRFPVRLEALQQAHGQFTSYEPELFPGLVYRMVRPRVVLLIFVNGKIVFTGGKTRNEISEALEIIYPILHSFRKN